MLITIDCEQCPYAVYLHEKDRVGRLVLPQHEISLEQRLLDYKTYRIENVLKEFVEHCRSYLSKPQLLAPVEIGPHVDWPFELFDQPSDSRHLGRKDASD